LQYQDCASAMQAADTAAEREAAPCFALPCLAAPCLAAPCLAAPCLAAPCLADANINPLTGLATDYLNHFIEAIMLLEMVATCPDCLDDFQRWQALSYREHFLASKFKGRELAIVAYEGADPAARASLDDLAATMTAVIEATRTTMTKKLSPLAAGPLADRAAAWLKILATRAGAVINGEIDVAQPGAAQAAVDRLMQRPD
jgi:hypothetical protein